jgi:hypothetical protein
VKKIFTFFTCAFLVFATTQVSASALIINQLPTTDKDVAKLIKDVALKVWEEEYVMRWMEQVGSDAHVDLLAGKTPVFLDAVQTFHMGNALGSKQIISANFRTLINLFSYAQRNSGTVAINVFLSQYLSARDAQIVAEKLPEFMSNLEATLAKNNRKK